MADLTQQKPAVDGAAAVAAAAEGGARAVKLEKRSEPAIGEITDRREFPTVLQPPKIAPLHYAHGLYKDSTWNPTPVDPTRYINRITSSAVISSSLISYDFTLFPCRREDGSVCLSTYRLTDHIIALNRYCARAGFPLCQREQIVEGMECAARELAAQNATPYMGALNAVLFRVVVLVRATDSRGMLPVDYIMRFSYAPLGAYCPEGRSMTIEVGGARYRTMRPVTGTEDMPDLPVVRGPRRALLRSRFVKPVVSGVKPNAFVSPDPFYPSLIDDADCGKLILVRYNVKNTSTGAVYKFSIDPTEAENLKNAVNTAMVNGQLDKLEFTDVRVVIAVSGSSGIGVAGATLKDAINTHLPDYRVVLETVPIVELQAYAEAFIYGTVARICPIMTAHNNRLLGDEDHNMYSFVKGYLPPITERIAAALQLQMSDSQYRKYDDVYIGGPISYPSSVQNSISSRMTMSTHVTHCYPTPKSYESSARAHNEIIG